MKIIMKRATALALTIIMLLSMAAVFSCDISGDNLENDGLQNGDVALAIEEQIRAFARSIDKPGANYSAAIALASHGIVGGGENLTVEQNHALTATLMNAELSLTTIIHGCTVGIEKMQELRLSSIFGDAGCYFGMNKTYYNVAALYREGNDDGVGKDVLQITKIIDYNDILNSYDSALVFIAGSTEIHMYIKEAEITSDAITYSVKVVFADDFDFNTNEGSIPREIASFLGSAIFREYKWTATAEFNLTLPPSF